MFMEYSQTANSFLSEAIIQRIQALRASVRDIHVVDSQDERLNVPARRYLASERRLCCVIILLNVNSQPRLNVKLYREILELQERPISRWMLVNYYYCKIYNDKSLSHCNQSTNG